jgi:acyl carrier protein
MLSSGVATAAFALSPNATQGPGDLEVGASIEAVNTVWQTLLNDEEASRSFFQLGGTSLLALELADELSTTLGVSVTLRHIMDNPEPAALAAVLARLPAVDVAAQALPEAHNIEGGAYTIAPASRVQERIWATEHLWQVDGAYNDCMIRDVAADLSPELVKTSLDQLVERHSILRTCFSSEGAELHQVIHESAPAIIEVIDLRGHPPDRADALVSSIAAAKVHEPFDLWNPGLLRTTLYQMPGVRTILQMVTHHLVSDGRSFAILLEELSDVYQAALKGEVARRSRASSQYVDYALWQNSEAARDAQREDEAWWMAKLARVTALPIGSSPGERSFRGGRVGLELTHEMSSALNHRAIAENATPSVLFMAAYHAALAHWCNVHDFVIATAVAGREHPTFRRTLGCFINMVPIRVHSERTWKLRSLLHGVRRSAFEALEHTSAPIERLVRSFNNASAGMGDALLNVAFVMDGMTEIGDVFGGVRCVPFPFAVSRAKFPLTLYVSNVDDRWRLEFEHMDSVVSADDAKELAGNVGVVLEDLVQNPDQVVGDVVALVSRGSGAFERDVEVDPGLGDPASGEGGTTPHLEALLAVVGEILGVDRVGPDDTLPALGAHSMQLLAFIMRVEDEWRHRFGLEDVIACTIRTLAGLLTRHLSATGDSRTG